MSSGLIIWFPVVVALNSFLLNGSFSVLRCLSRHELTMIVIAVANNILALFPHRLHDYGVPVQLVLFTRLLAALPACVVSFFASDLAGILEFTGLFGILIAFIFPSALQYYSRRRCIAVFGIDRTPFSNLFSTDRIVWPVLLFGVFSILLLVVVRLAVLLK